MDAGWVNCDPVSGRAIDSASDSDEPEVAGIIAVSVAATMLCVAAVVLVAFIGYWKYSKYSLRQRDNYEAVMMDKLSPE